MINNSENVTYQLNCCHCGEFISLNLENHAQSGLIHDNTLGDVRIDNIYENEGPSGSYQSMDTELTCPRCHYTFKSTVRRNFY